MKITILLIILLIVLVLCTTNIVATNIVVMKIPKKIKKDTLSKHLEVQKNCPRIEGSYKQCTDTGTYRHSLKDIKNNHIIYKHNPRVNIWNTTE